MKDVFISHATEDQPIAAEVCALLEARGIHCWIAPRDVAPGGQWDDAIVDSIGSAHTFLLILSAKANESLVGRASLTPDHASDPADLLR